MNFIKRYCVLLRINMFDSNSSKKNEKEVLSFSVSVSSFTLTLKKDEQFQIIHF